MKGSRLDQILLRLGFVTEDQIRKALMRQKAHGGRLGSHLLFLEYLSEDQLVRALSEQYKVAAFNPVEQDIDASLLELLPVEMAEDLQMFPFRYDSKTDTLFLAVADPSDIQSANTIKRVFEAKRCELFVTPESIITDLVAEYYRGGIKQADAKQMIELPELFAENRSINVEYDLPLDTPRSVLVVTKAASLRNFLGPVFVREGYTLTVVSDQDDLIEIPADACFDRVLVSEDMMSRFEDWVRSHKLIVTGAEISSFHSVTSALLDNPVSYQRIVKSLFRAVELLLESRITDAAAMAPYALVARDIRELGERFSLPRVAIDGVQLAAHLLVPPASVDPQRAPGSLPAGDFATTINHAKTLHFPWDVVSMLGEFHRLYTNGITQEATALTSQILAAAWYRHVLVPEDADLNATCDGIRQVGGVLVRPELAEAYANLVVEQNQRSDHDDFHQVLVVSTDESIYKQFLPRLKRTGCETVWTDDFDDAQHMCNRQSPSAVIVHYESFQRDVFNASRLFKLHSGVQLYAYTFENNNGRTLRLLDSGFDDVFVPPHDFDVIAARIGKAVRVQTQRGNSRVTAPGGFHASFAAFSFLDVIQSLGQAQKSVRVMLSGGGGQRGEVFMERGQLIAAICGEVQGAEAIYRIITWEDEGEFVVEPMQSFPEPNIFDSNESILMEGCRLLDESRV